MTLVEGSRDPEVLEQVGRKHRMVQIAADNRDLFVRDAHRNGWSYREIAEELGMSVSGVHKMALRAEERDQIFRRDLERAGFGQGDDGVG